MLVPSDKLRDFVKMNVDQNQFVSKAKDAYRKVFQRPGRNDLITLVSTEELKEIASHFWQM